MKTLRLWLKNFKLKEKWGDLLVFLSPLLFSLILGMDKIIDSLSIFWLTIMIILVLSLSLLGWFQSIKNSQSVSKLLSDKIMLESQKEHVEDLLASLPEEFCKLLFNKWNLHDDARITIYRHTSESFIPVSRYAKNPDYDTINRPSYPKDVGYISECWAQKEGVYITDLPDPKKNLQEYINLVNKETDMLKKDIKKLPMKSRSYFGQTLYDENKKAFLLVMVESTETEIKNIDIIKKDLKGTLSEFISSTVKSNITPKGGQNNEQVEGNN